MAAEQGYTLSEQAVRKIVDDHRRLSHQVYRIEQRLPATNDPPDWGRELLWGKTTTRPGESYPEEGDTYSVLLASRSYDQTAVGSKAVTDADSSDGVYVTARTLTGCSLPEDTYVELERLWGKDGVQYWIRPPFATVRKVALNDSLAIDGSAEARLYIDGADSGETITVHWNWMREGSTIDADTELLAIWFEDESKWCIIPPPVPGTAATIYAQPFIVGELNHYWKNDGSGKSVDNNFRTHTVKLFPSGVGVTGNALGLAYTVKSNPAAYTDDWLVIRQTAFYRVIATFYWSVDLLSQSDAESTLRAAAHSHTYDDYLDPFTFVNRTTANATPDATRLRRRIIGAKMRIAVTGQADSEGYTTQEIYWAQPGASERDPRICCTVMAYINVGATTKAVNLFADTWYNAGSSDPATRIQAVHVTVEQMTQPTAQL